MYYNFACYDFDNILHFIFVRRTYNFNGKNNGCFERKEISHWGYPDWKENVQSDLLSR